MKPEKFTIKVRIENQQIFNNEYNPNNKLHVIVERTISYFHITADERELHREDGTLLSNLQLRIEDIPLRDGETLIFIKKAPKPDRDKGFAYGRI